MNFFWKGCQKKGKKQHNLGLQRWIGTDCKTCGTMSFGQMSLK